MTTVMVVPAVALTVMVLVVTLCAAFRPAAADAIATALRGLASVLTAFRRK